MGHEETEKSVEEIVDMIKKGDLSLAPKLYEQTKGIICYVIWREWRREHIRRGTKARGMEVEDLQQEGYFMMLNPPSYMTAASARISRHICLPISEDDSKP